jgi:hypothetical protein
MGLKLFKGVWFLSLLVVLGSFMYVYASLPEVVILQDSGAVVSISREALFYVVLALLALSNVVVFIISKLQRQRDREFVSWFYGLIVTLNIFFIIALSFVSLYNSSEKFNYSRIGWIIYGSVGLMIIWAIGWPVYTIFRKIYSKQMT